MAARLMRYGHQPISEIENLGPDRLRFYFKHLMDVIEAENQSTKGKE